MATVAVGLTGEPGAGKSTASRWLASQGAALIYADAIVRDLWNGRELPAEARKRWGDTVFLPDGRIDKRAVSARVFSDDDEYRWLCSTTHPIVERRMEELLPSDGIAVAEIPMLFEAGRYSWIDKVIFIAAGAGLRAQRNSFRGLDARELSRREKFFLPSETRKSMSDWVVYNDGTPERLESQLAGIWEEIVKLYEMKRSSEGK